MTLFRRFCGALLLLLISSVPALAGVNAGGVLVAHDAGLLMSQTNTSVALCEQLPAPSNLAAVDARINGAAASDPAIFGVYAVFPSGSSPRLSGITWGIHYDADALFFEGFASCGDFSQDMDEWPNSDTGSTVTWDNPQTNLVVSVYYFSSYLYLAESALFELIPHPEQGGTFGDDTIPAVLDPIAGYGKLGFDMDGFVPAEGGEAGACCNRSTGECTVISAMTCGNNIFKGPGTTCDPNPCGTGACCGLQAFFCQDLTRTECDAAGGAFLGLETTCTINGEIGCHNDRWGACCNGTACEVTELGGCETIWLANIGCVPVPCTAGLGACCQDINCTVRIESECTGVWIPDTDCSHSFPCNPAPGACCTGASCAVVSQAECSDPEAFWLANKDCTPNACETYGSCCHGGPDPQPCEITTMAGCAYTWTASHACSAAWCASPTEKATWGHIKATYRDRR